MRFRPIRFVPLLVIVPFLFGQAIAPSTPRVPAPVVPPTAASIATPTLQIDDAAPAARSAVHLDAIKVDVVLNAPLAQTTVTLTFKNTLNRQLEGTLEFPLPENAAVVGYALDVPAGSGTLVEGVCVEKERGRRIFETEQRRGIDPGLVEQTRGNNYRTRIHPIPAGGTRTVQLTYVSDMFDLTLQAGDARGPRFPSSSVYSLPLNFTAGHPLTTASLHVEVPGISDARMLQVNGLPGLAFAAKDGKLVAEKQFSNVTLSGSLDIFQNVPPQALYSHVESRFRRPNVENANNVRDPDTYFLVSAVVPAGVSAAMQPPAKLLIAWDTSLSRASADRSAELSALAEILKQTNAPFEVLSTDGTSLKTGTPADAPALLAFLKDLPCDGALNLDGLQQKLASLAPDKPTAVLFFSDGIVTLGKRELRLPDVSSLRLYTLSSDPRADHAFLQRLAKSGGGHYLNLQRAAPADAAKALLSPPLTATVYWEQGKPSIAEVYPAGTLSVTPGLRITFTGKLLLPEATLHLKIGDAVQDIVLKTEGAGDTGMVPRFWAQQKAAALEADATRNADALLALGKEFNVVTSHTSLLVLETVDQYVRHRVVPPQSAKDLYNGFIEQIEKQSTLAKAEEQQKIDRVLALWNKRVEWWNTKFTPHTRTARTTCGKNFRRAARTKRRNVSHHRRPRSTCRTVRTRTGCPQ